MSSPSKSLLRTLVSLIAVLLPMMCIAPAALCQQTTATTSNRSGNSNDGFTSEIPSSYVISRFGTDPLAIPVWQPPASDSSLASTRPRSDEEAPPPGIISIWPAYTYFRSPARHFFMYGMRASGDAGTDGSYTSSINPYVGLMSRTRTGFYVLQYSPTITPDTPTGQGTVAFHALSFDATGGFSRRWSWGLAVSDSYGSEFARLSGPLAIQAVSPAGIPIADTTSAALQPFNGKEMALNANFSTTYQMTPRDSIAVSVSDTYFSFNYDTPVTPNVHSDMAGLNLTFGHMLTRRATLTAYSQVAHIYSNLLPCTSYGGGLGISYKITPTVGLDAGGGPSTGCGDTTGNFHATMSAVLGKQVTVYVSGSRQLMTQFRQNSRWENNVAGGGGKRVRNAEFGVDAGYYQGQPLGLNAPSQGYFISPRIGYALNLKPSRMTSIGFSFRRFSTLSSTTATRAVNVAMVSVTFSPNPVPFEKTRTMVGGN
jgi:hypothetical protein